MKLELQLKRQAEKLMSFYRSASSTSKNAHASKEHSRSSLLLQMRAQAFYRSEASKKSLRIIYMYLDILLLEARAKL